MHGVSSGNIAETDYWAGAAKGGVTYMQVPIGEIRIKNGRRRLDSGHVQELADSIRELGLLNPVTIDRGNFLIAGFHRLEAAKALGWTEIECTVSSLGGLQAELAEIDENIVRSDLSALEYGEILLRRKEIYETLHPETRHGGDRKSNEIKTTKCRFENVKSFVQDTADKLGVVPRTVERQIQTAKNLAPEAKAIIRDTNTKLSKKAAMKLSRLDSEQQKEVAALLAAKEIRSVDEYATRTETENPLYSLPNADGTEAGQWTEEEGSIVTGRELDAAPVPQDVPQEYAEPSAVQEGKGRNASLKELVAELKDPEKDCSGTPESFLEEYAAFMRKFRREIAWYSDTYYDTVYPHMDRMQLSFLREITDAICSDAENLFHRVERMMKV